MFTDTKFKENFCSCRTERKKRIEDWIQRRSEYLDDLDEALRMSIEATDAEELSVSLDVCSSIVLCFINESLKCLKTFCNYTYLNNLSFTLHSHKKGFS